jgi:hypothetical protein
LIINAVFGLFWLPVLFEPTFWLNPTGASFPAQTRPRLKRRGCRLVPLAEKHGDKSRPRSETLRTRLPTANPFLSFFPSAEQQSQNMGTAAEGRGGIRNLVCANGNGGLFPVRSPAPRSNRSAQGLHNALQQVCIPNAILAWSSTRLGFLFLLNNRKNCANDRLVSVSY